MCSTKRRLWLWQVVKIKCKVKLKFFKDVKFEILGQKHFLWHGCNSATFSISQLKFVSHNFMSARLQYFYFKYCNATRTDWSDWQPKTFVHDLWAPKEGTYSNLPELHLDFSATFLSEHQEKRKKKKLNWTTATQEYFQEIWSCMNHKNVWWIMNASSCSSFSVQFSLI